MRVFSYAYIVIQKLKNDTGNAEKIWHKQAVHKDGRHKADHHDSRMIKLYVILLCKQGIRHLSLVFEDDRHRGRIIAWDDDVACIILHAVHADL